MFSFVTSLIAVVSSFFISAFVSFISLFITSVILPCFHIFYYFKYSRTIVYIRSSKVSEYNDLISVPAQDDTII
jgi:hypothetical protein